MHGGFSKMGAQNQVTPYMCTGYRNIGRGVLIIIIRSQYKVYIVTNPLDTLCCDCEFIRTVNR